MLKKEDYFSMKKIYLNNFILILFNKNKFKKIFKNN